MAALSRCLPFTYDADRPSLCQDPLSYLAGGAEHLRVTLCVSGTGSGSVMSQTTAGQKWDKCILLGTDPEFLHRLGQKRTIPGVVRERDLHDHAKLSIP